MVLGLGVEAEARPQHGPAREVQPEPMIQLPWFDYTPNRLREAAKPGPGGAGL